MNIYLYLITSYPAYMLLLSFLCYTSGVNWTWLYYRECYWIFYETILKNIVYFIVKYWVGQKVQLFFSIDEKKMALVSA